jgi:hypothetical protein
MNPNCPVLSPIMHMIIAFTVTSSQPCHWCRPTKIVEVIVKTQDK